MTGTARATLRPLLFIWASSKKFRIAFCGSKSCLHGLPSISSWSPWKNTTRSIVVCLHAASDTQTAHRVDWRLHLASRYFGIALLVKGVSQFPTGARDGAAGGRLRGVGLRGRVLAQCSNSLWPKLSKPLSRTGDLHSGYGVRRSGKSN